MPDRDVAELCMNYATLEAERVVLDQRIQNAIRRKESEDPSGTDDDGTVVKSSDCATDYAGNRALGPDGLIPSLSEGSQAGSDIATLWVELEDVLEAQAYLVISLFKLRATSLRELRLKAEVLASELRRIGSGENELVQYLSESIVSDIAILFDDA